jgi:MFS family permease
MAAVGSGGPAVRLDGRYAWGVVGVLMLAQSVSFIDRMIMGLLVGPVRKSFEISDTQYSLLAGFAFAVFYAVMGLPLGRMVDGGRRTRIVAVAMAFWSLMTALCGLAWNFWSLFLARVGVGVGEAALSPAAYSIISDYFTKARLARALSVYTVGVTIGSGLAYIVGGWVVGAADGMGQVVLPLVGAREGWQLTFFLVGLPGLILAPFVLMIREPPRRGVVDAEAPSIRRTLAFMWARRDAYGPHILGMALFVMAVFSVNIWGPEYLIRTFGYGRAEAGQTFGVLMLVAGTSGLLLGGALADRLVGRGVANGYNRVILGSMACMTPCVALLWVAGTPAAGIACIGAAVFFSAFQGGIGGGYIQLITPNRMRGQALAVYLLATNLLGMGLGPTVVAAITDYGFGDDGALNRSLAVFGVVIIPLAALIMLAGLRRMTRALQDARSWAEA